MSYFLSTHLLCLVTKFIQLVAEDTKVLQATHFALITSCIQYLKSITSTLGNSEASVNLGPEMAVDLSEEETMRTHLEFQRSVQLLGRLIKGYRMRPHCTNPIPPGERGDPIRVRCEIIGKSRNVCSGFLEFMVIVILTWVDCLH